MTSVRIRIDQDALTFNSADSADRPPIVASKDGQVVVAGHEAAILCPCCGGESALVVAPPGVDGDVWVEVAGKLVVFRRTRRNDRRSYEQVAELG